MNILSKAFSRERSVSMAYIWNDCDRRAWKLYVGHDMQNNLFIRKGQMLEVYYDNKEFSHVLKILEQNLNQDPQTFDALESDFNSHWQLILPYLESSKTAASIEELKQYYDNLIKWGATLELLFHVPPFESVSEDIKKRAMDLRKKTEQFDERLDSVLVDYFKAEDKQEVAMLLTPQEMFGYYDAELVRKRAAGCFVLNEKLGLLTELDSELKKNDIELDQGGGTEKIETIKGQVAFEGKAKGTVKVVLLAKDLDKVTDGDILVAPMTMPTYLPAMKRAAAFVTDEGGITCHAAIIAREMKKPCVIGTKIATEVLKDGMEVEVDADQGKVKIIS